MSSPKQITRDDILSPQDYLAQRAVLRKRIVDIKKPRRIDVGPYATFYFESYETMLQQIQEMLYIEKGGEEQLVDELEAYNPMVPQGKELTVTLMFEIDDPARRGTILRRLTDVELTAFVDVDGEKVYAQPEQDVERTASDGKTSSVHFLHFPFPDHLIAKFCSDEGQMVLGSEHENYAHMTILTPETRKSLSQDFDH